MDATRKKLTVLGSSGLLAKIEGMESLVMMERTAYLRDTAREWSKDSKPRCHQETYRWTGLQVQRCAQQRIGQQCHHCGK